MLLPLIAALAMLADAPPPVKHVRQKVVELEPVWLAQPSREDIDKQYPPLARQYHDNGRAIVECTAQEDGSLADCSIVSERPEHEGFGEATLRLTPLYRLADAQGRSVKGFKAQVTVAWGVLP